MNKLLIVKVLVYFIITLFISSCSNPEIVVVVKNTNVGRIYIDDNPIDKYVKSSTGQSNTDSTYYLALNPGKYNVKIKDLKSVIVLDTTISIFNGAYYGIDLVDQTFINL